MWAVSKTKEEEKKEEKGRYNFTITPSLYKQFRKVADKDMRKYSNIVERAIQRYVQTIS